MRPKSIQLTSSPRALLLKSAADSTIKVQYGGARGSKELSESSVFRHAPPTNFPTTYCIKRQGYAPAGAICPVYHTVLVLVHTPRK